MDSSAYASGKHILDFNDCGWWLKLLCGAPVTTGTGPYTHVFTVTLDQRLSAMLEFVIGATGSEKFSQFLGMSLNELGWNVMAGDQSFTTGLIGAVEVKHFPTAVFDVAPAARYPPSRSYTKRGHISHVLNARTLGGITQAHNPRTNAT